jgi:hypothetical protein
MDWILTILILAGVGWIIGSTVLHTRRQKAVIAGIDRRYPIYKKPIHPAAKNMCPVCMRGKPHDTKFCRRCGRQLMWTLRRVPQERTLGFLMFVHEGGKQIPLSDWQKGIQ